MNLPALLRFAAPFKKYVSLLIVILTIGVFAYYLRTHPDTIRQLGQSSPILIAALLALFALMLGSLSIVYLALVRLCGQHIPKRENLSLTCYSTLVNFFGPLQSGPGFRAAYLKKRHNVSLRKYTIATIAYYGLYGLFSALFLAVGGGLWWAVGALLVIFAVSIGLVVPRYVQRLNATPSNVVILTLATFAQVAIFAVSYFMELRSVEPGVSLSQVLAYTGTANLSLFASLTPGAIGIREAFLVFTQNLHHLSDTAIVAASVLDRAVYIVFLGLLFVATLSLHAKKRFAKDLAS